MTLPVSRESTVTLERIEAKRAAVGVSGQRLERVAGLATGRYWRLIAHDINPRPDTLAALSLALNRLEQNRDCDATERARLTYMVLQVITALVCEIEGVDASAVRLQDPRRRATNSPDWMRAAEIRREVFGLANSGLGLSQSQIAAAAGMTRSAVHLALKPHEDRREDAAYDARITRLETAIRGSL